MSPVDSKPIPTLMAADLSIENLPRSVTQKQSNEFAISFGKLFKLISPWLR